MTFSLLFFSVFLAVSIETEIITTSHGGVRVFLTCHCNSFAAMKCTAQSFVCPQPEMERRHRIGEMWSAAEVDGPLFDKSSLSVMADLNSCTVDH